MDPVLMRRLAKPLLFSAAFIWGTSFFIMKNTLDAVPVLWLLTFRFTTGAVLVGLLCGWFNSVMVTKLKIPAMVTTLATMYLFQGIARGITQGESVYAFPF